MAEPAYNSGGLIGFDDTSNGNTNNSGTLPTPPITSPTSPISIGDSNVTAVSTPILEGISGRNLSLELVEDNEGNFVYVKISEFEKEGSIKLTGQYSQNYVDFDKYNLSPIRVLSDINFKFILCLKETESDTESVYYTSKLFFDELQSSYQNDNEPYLVNASIKKEKIVVITLTQFKERVEGLRYKELTLPITELFSGGVIVNKNLFVNSNYTQEVDSDGNLKANPTYDLDELVRYINWVVSKPSSNYEQRLLDAREIGNWAEVEQKIEEDTTPTENEPSTQTNTSTTNQQSYPPIGRAGTYVGEIQSINSELFQWSGAYWSPFDFGSDGPPGGFD